MLPTDFICHYSTSKSSVHVKPISTKEEKIIDIPPIVSSYSSSLSYLNIQFNFTILDQFWYIRPNDSESELVSSTWPEGSTESTQFVLHLSDKMLYNRLDFAISSALADWKEEFEGQYRVIIEKTTRQLQRIMTTKMSSSEVSVDVELLIDNVCDGRILSTYEEESSMDIGMVPASKSSIEMLEQMDVDEINSNDECTICLDEIGEETDVLRLPCSHMFHSDCITKWLHKSHYCPLCRFELPTD